MEITKLEKSEYSEWVVRNSLYWLSSVTTWNMKSTETLWLIELGESDKAITQELDRLLNDYTLRESIMLKTGNVRDAIAVSVLEGIQARLTE
ncbi:MAG: His-Xaa-Ser system protein HxsD [Pseudomonadales bacterium]